MDSFHLGHAIAEHWHGAASEVCRQLGTLPSDTNLGLLYVSDAFVTDLDAIVDYLKHQTGVPHWVGSTGVGICANTQEYYAESAIAVLVGSLPGNSFRVFSAVKDDLHDFSRDHRRWYQEGASHFAIVHGDPGNAETPALIAALAHELPGGFLAGGIASSRTVAAQVADEVTRGGLSGVMFSSKVAVMTRLTQGCSPIGPVREVTHCERNIAMRIDGRPALDVFQEDIGELLARDMSRAAGYIFAGLPIRGSDTGDYLVRNLLGVDRKNRLLAIGDLLHPGDPIMFCRRDAHTAREDMERMLLDVKRHITAPPRAGVYFSCLGRGGVFFGENSAEQKMIREHLGDIPLAGFYANGEISHDRLYGYTGVLALFL